jgi:hypothetical protein
VRAQALARPRAIRIGAFTYKVIWEEHVLELDRYGKEDPEQETLSARADHMTLEIHVSTSLVLAVQRKSLLHEVIHACNWITGHDDAVNEEEFVRALAFPMLDVLRDNPQLVAFLTSPD